MELVLKVPTGKPPFIGILFVESHVAGSLNADLVIDHKDKKFKIVLELIHKHLNLRLICDDLVTVRFYNHLKYNPEKLKSWLYILHSTKATSINFSHLTMAKDKHILATTTPKTLPFILKIESCQILAQSNSL